MKIIPKNIIKKIDFVEKYILVIPMLFFAFGVVIDVIFRKFFHFNLSFLQEFGKYLMVYITFIGASIGVKIKAHPNMSAVIDVMPDKFKIIFVFISNLLCALAMGFTGYWSWMQFSLYKRMGTVTTTLENIPVYLLYLVVPVSLTVMSIRFFMRCYTDTREISKTIRVGVTYK